MVIAQTGGVDPGDSIQLRIYWEAMRGQLETERSSWDQQYYQLSGFFMPKNQRFNPSNVDNGQRADYNIIDETGTLTLRFCAAGMLSGMSPRTSAWFQFTTEDAVLMENREVKYYLQQCEQIVRDALLKSNFYDTVLNAYKEIALYGTTVFTIVEDAKTDFRCYPAPLGSYYLSGSKTLRPDFFMRIVNMTIRQVVDEFGWDNCSPATQAYFNSPGAQKDMWWPLVHVIHKSDYFGPKHMRTNPATGKPWGWTSTYYELNTYSGPKGNEGILRTSGFEENPVIAARWDVVGENFYGFSPAMDVLGTNMALQTLQTRILQGIDKQVNPPMVADPALMSQSASVRPGDVTYVSMKDGTPGFKPAYQVNFQMDHASAMVQDHRKRIETGLYKDVFMLISGDDRSDITAEEIKARLEEKMTVLGPVVHRSIAEILQPTIERVLPILHRHGKLPKKPPQLHGKDIKIEFISILAAAEKARQLNNIKQFLQVVGSDEAVEAGAGQQILNTIKADKLIRRVAELTEIPADCMNTPEEAAALAAQQAKAAQDAQNAKNAQALSTAAGNLANIPTGGDNALSRVAPHLTGPPQ